MRVQLALVAALGVLFATARTDVPLHAYDSLLDKAQADPAGAFEEFARLHARPYLGDAAEYQRRQAVFQANLARIAAHNARPDVTFQLGLNGHADLSVEEFRLRYFGAQPKDIGELREASEAAEAAEAAAASAHAAAGAPSNKKEKHPKGSPFPYGDEVPPPRRDWRAEGKVTPVKDQHVGGAPCGCCYAFGGVAGIEGALEACLAANALYTGELTTLAEQEIVDCDQLDYGCDGGDFANVFKWAIENGGLSTDAAWPYLARETSCPRKRQRRQKAVTIDGFVMTPRHNETALMQALSHTPTVVAVCCGDYLDQWHLYKSGIMGDSVQCAKPLDHSVLVVGYDTDAATGEDYWLVKNSWGAHWGEAGYLRLKRNQTMHRNGQAGLLSFPGYAFKTSPNPEQVERLSARGGGKGLGEAWASLWTAWDSQE